MRKFVIAFLSLRFVAALAASLVVGSLSAQDDVQSEPVELPADTPSDASYAEPYVDDAGCDCCADGTGDCCSQADLCTYFEPAGAYWDGDTRILRSHFLGRLWAEGEYLAWSARSTRLPPLVSASSTPAGDTTLLFGGSDEHDQWRSGGRLTAGYWFTPDHNAGIEASFFEVDGLDIQFEAVGDSTSYLFRPIIDATSGLSDVVPVTDRDGAVSLVQAQSRVQLSGAELLWRQRMRTATGHRVDWVAGYRYLRLYDGLSVDEASLDIEQASDGTIINYLGTRSEWFQSENEFHGGQFGLIGRWWGCRWALQALGKVALGGTRTAAFLDGGTAAVEFTDETILSSSFHRGGVLALPSNIGTYGQSEMAGVLELGVRLEYALTKQWRATFGYTYLYWSSISRIPDSMDQVVDQSQIWSGQGEPGTGTRPTFAFSNQSFWTHGLTVGVHYDF